MSIQSQLYEVPSYRYRSDPYNSDSISPGAVATAMLSFLFALAVLALIFWRLPAKAGFTGAARWFWFLTMICPLTCGLSLVTFVFVPWPTKKQQEKSQKQLDELRRLSLQAKPVTVDDELDQLRRQMRQ